MTVTLREQQRARWERLGPTPERFYNSVDVEEIGPEYAVRLDGKRVRTPGKRYLHLPARALADAVAAEWDAQRDAIEPEAMPLTRLANSAIDGVAHHAAAVVADIVAFAGRDLVCYRAQIPPDLVARQSACWDPVITWANAKFGGPFVVTHGVMPVDQPKAALSGVEAHVSRYSAFALAAVHVMAGLSGSALLAIAIAEGAISASDAWAAAHIDEDWQAALWGEDGDAVARRARRWRDMQVADEFLRLGQSRRL